MIQNLKLYVILNSSGSHALLVKLWARSGCYQAIVPVAEATAEKIRNIKSTFSTIRSNFTGLNEEDWLSFDTMLKQLGTKGDKLDPSLSLAMSIACARAAGHGDIWRIKGPVSKFPYIVGIVAAGRTWNQYLMIPHKERTVRDAFKSLHEVHKVIGEELQHKGVLRGKDTNGGWVSDLGDTEMLYLLDQVSRDWNMSLGLNVNASRIWDGKNYDYTKNRGTVVRKKISAEEQMSLLSAIMEHYNIWYLEDPFNKSDFISHSHMSHKFEESFIAGGELYGADTARMKRGYKLRPTKVISVNPKDLKSISHLSEIVDFANGKALKISLSRSDKETEDNWLSDLSLAFGTFMVKLGVSGSDNIAKYNRLLEMWDDVPGPSMGKIGE